MARKKLRTLFGYKHVKKRPRKRPGRHSKNLNKRSRKKKYKGQGR